MEGYEGGFSIVADLGTFREDGHAMPNVRLTDEEYARSTSALPVICTDIVIVDEADRFVLAYRTHPAAKGWWWKGGSWKARFTRAEAIASILSRELGYVPERVTLLAVFDHFWSMRREIPEEVGRHDLILLHFVKLDEATIARLALDPDEYDASRGFLRYDGTQEVRPIVRAAYELYRTRAMLG